MQIQLLVTIDYDPFTGETKTIKSEVFKQQKEELKSPVLTLENNKYLLNPAAVKLLNVTPGDRLGIRFIDNAPFIAKSDVWSDEDTSNKVTKTYTVSYRGEANKVLAKYGTTFLLVAAEDGKFKLDSGVECPVSDEKVLDELDINSTGQSSTMDEIDALLNDEPQSFTDEQLEAIDIDFDDLIKK